MLQYEDRKEHRPLNLPSDSILTPANGHYYVEEDRELVFAQQPLDPSEAPESLLPDPKSTLRPPILHYGWLVGYERLMQVVFDHFPEVVRKRYDPNFDEEETRCAARHPTMPGWVFNANRTLYGPEFITAICEYVDLPTPEECDGFDCGNFFEVTLFQSGPHHADLGFSIGTNYFGVLAEEGSDKLKVLFGIEEDPKWYLDFYKWKWVRVPRKTETRKESPP